MSDPIRVDDAVVDGVRAEFRRLSAELDNAREPLRGQADRVASGAGEFATAMADGLTAFQLSWGAALAAVSDSAGTVAANVGGFVLDLDAVDRASS